ncbi:MAG TPA: lipopolysaccharide core heptose(I) kinase RfaP [Pseudomonas sp.]|jgi:heptose I phosphotransferase|uniref:lipopolysaccharide core heptose(I) kinase RfaP n=1 Tax=Pseudomonas sp. TaxID=306 RepID=UPI002CA3D9B6|nr:lipopolysaccharide core heptose(I) kinase RfaP [Pseudomonas sp.]HTO18497.1 lipopolysaccharide core heptose(I) kinase RfaP [Pseudomonas sp.]
MNLFLAEPLSTLWAGKDPFAEVETLQGPVYRQKEGRKVFRVELFGRGYFVKLHRGVGWGEIFKNLLSFRLPVLGARQELSAIRRLEQAGIATLNPVGFGQRGFNPARQFSFLITEELAPTISLEDFCQDWARTPPPVALKRALIGRVAQIVRDMHAAGLNHRDCYLCHFLLHTDSPPTPDHLPLSVIDLHRSQVRTRVPLRWRDKDLAGLYFSALGIGLTRSDKLRFLRAYFGKPLRQVLVEEASVLAWMERKAARIQARDQRKIAEGEQR